MNFSFKKFFGFSMEENVRSHIFFKILVCLSCLWTQCIFACGYYLESLCQSSNPCQSELNLEPDVSNQYCTLSGIKNKIWKTYPIDDSRDNLENCHGMNCWKYDDIVRHKLNMDSSKLEYSEPISGEKKLSLEVHAHDQLQDGRYIYVIRTTDGKMIMRHYDQEYTSINFSPLIVRFDYSRFRDPNNYRMYDSVFNQSSSCESTALLPLGATCHYLPVRQSQLNGTQPDESGRYQESNAWDPVYCAGELRVHNKKIDRINNQSDYFKPNEQCVSNALMLLRALDIPIDAAVKAGNYKKINTAEVFDCQNTGNDLIPDVIDEHYHACAYIIFSQSPIGGLLATPVYQGRNVCSHQDIIWIWSHSHTCSGQLYSRGAEY